MLDDCVGSEGQSASGQMRAGRKGHTLASCSGLGDWRSLSIGDRQKRVHRVNVLNTLIALPAKVKLGARDAWRERDRARVVSVCR